MRTRAAHLVPAAALLLLLAGTAGAGDLALVAGHVETSGCSEAADWDTSDGYAASDYAFGGGWDGDTQCADGGCVSSSSGVVTQGGTASTLSSTTLLPTGGTASRFPTLTGGASTTADATVSPIGILSDADADSSGWAVVVPTATTTVSLAGTVSGSASGAGSTAYGFVAVLTAQGRFLAVAGGQCTPGAPCSDTFARSVRLRAGRAYLILTGAHAETSTGSQASARADVDWTLTEVAGLRAARTPAVGSAPERADG